MVKFLLVLAFVAQIIYLASATNGYDKRSYRRYQRRTPRATFTCGKNEIWATCPEAVCAPKTCDDVGYPVPCYDLGPDGKCPSKPCCICKEGFVKDHRGVCIPMEFCPSCGGDPNAVSGCGTYCNQLCSDYDQEDEFCTLECNYNACDCKDGYFFDEITEMCVEPSQCTVENKCKGPNEIYDPCPAPCPPETCDANPALILCAVPPQLGDPDCKPACRCKDGFLRNSTGICIPEDDCPKCTKPHEVYVKCPPSCPPPTCENVGKKHHCPLMLENSEEKKKQCNGQCMCEKGYYRNILGECILKKDCLKCQGPNEYFSCGPACDNVCSSLHERNQTNCPIVNIVCNPMCYCIEGYARDKYNICIPIEKCKVPRCPKHEVYSTCIQGNCNPQNCSQVGFPVPCPRIDPAYCKKGCICEEGYARNDNGYCVPINKCPSCKGDPNKVPGCGVYCNQRCSDLGKEAGACIEICYENACDCRKGYYLDEYTGLCVLPKHCTPKCPLNEEYSTCIQGNCSPQNCTQVGFPVPCPRVDPAYCKKGCVCIEGHARNDQGYCVPINECPSCNGDPNKVPGCGVYCNQRCSDIGKEPAACIAVCYENACNCRKGYYLDENTGLCVLPKHCTPQCPFNEEFSKCVQGNCRPQNCADVGFQTGCPKIDPEYCKKGCICKEGYARNEQGYCVPLNECPTCEGDPNKVPGCGVYCNQRCRDLGKKPGACIRICKVNSCDCQEGYYLDENTGFCVLPHECSPQCPVNEFYSECTQGNCSPENCTQLGFPIACPRVDPKYCKKGCLCKEGYARDYRGVCIPSQECPSCGGDPNAQSGCGGYCNRRCSDIGKEPGPCILICQINGCDCREGYYYDDKTKRCVKPEQCTRRCPADEIYSDCINGGCQARNCSQYGKLIPCVKMDPKYCIKGCVCQEGYLRAPNGKCVPEDNCPEACNQLNEEYDECSWNCPPQTCESLDRAYACPIKSGQNCKPMCRCKSGYFRNKLGQCITEKQCRQCMGPHEYYSCGGACDNVCETLQTQSQNNCPIVNIKCNEKCYCEEGYARARNNTCIPISCCKDDPICGKHEVYEDCSNPLCKAEYCKDLGFPLNCKAKCRKGCICEEGYARDSNGRCIPVKQCPSCGGDPNAESGCGGNCGRHCSDIDKGPVACPAICKLNGCDCKKGYYFDDILKKCVKPEKCHNRCPVNERYEECPGTTCEPQFCNQLGFPVPCPEEVTNSCPKKPSCVCIDGYVRDGNGKCIPKNQCPCCGGDPFARSGCGVNCGKRCRDLGKGITPCLKICYPNACDCIDGYYYDSKQRKCVLPRQCTDICDKNEIYEDCSKPTCKAKTCDELGFPLNCNATCLKGCVCQNGYVRNENGICIPTNHCPSCGGDPNAHLGCGTNCGKRCPNNYVNPKFCPRIACVPELNRCDCNDGFYYDINTKTCVKPEDCSPRCITKNNEEYDPCVNGGCGWRNCSQVGGPILCIDPIKCEKGCRCREGYYSLDNGICVPKNKCPITPRCDDFNNEVYDPCPPLCPPQTCESIGHKYFCPKQNECKGQCRCKPNMYRNLIGECISRENCLKCQGPNEYFSCGTACDNVCGKLDTESKNNCPIKTLQCVPRCYCQDGYARNGNGICIPIKQCPCE